MTINLESNCPRRSSKDVQRSRQASALNAILRPLLLNPYGCRSCFRRFFAPRALTMQHPADAMQAAPLNSRAAAG